MGLEQSLSVPDQMFTTYLIKLYAKLCVYVCIFQLENIFITLPKSQWIHDPGKFYKCLYILNLIKYLLDIYLPSIILGIET